MLRHGGRQPDRGRPRSALLPPFRRWHECAPLDCVYAEVDPVTQHGVIITGDVAAHGATFLDALSPYTADQVAESLEQYAILHGRSWAPGGVDEPWLAPRLEATMRARGLPEIRGNFEGPIGSLVPEEVRDAERLLDAVRRLAELLERAEHRCLLHGDAHIGNIYVDAHGHPCLVDWQLVQRGPWYMDVGYHLGCTMSPEERQRTESDLLRHYLDRLGAAGADGPSWDGTRRLIGRGLVYGFFLWAITLKVAPPITTAMLGRLGSAVADHDAYASMAATVGAGTGGRLHGPASRKRPSTAIFRRLTDLKTQSNKPSQFRSQIT